MPEQLSRAWWLEQANFQERTANNALANGLITQDEWQHTMDRVHRIRETIDKRMPIAEVESAENSGEVSA